ncbi:hypothetical protein HTY52_06340 [Cupriavidus taiwanensis]|nr:hypothetical protein [Cupriavidus taiwanensis]
MNSTLQDRLVHRYIEVAEYPDGRIALWADGASLPYTTYDRLAEIDQVAIVEHKRRAHVLRMAQEMRDKRDNRRSAGAPAWTTAAASQGGSGQKTSEITCRRSGSGS